MIDTPPTFAFQSPDARPVGGRGGVRVDVARMAPAAPDGEAWWAAIVPLAARVAAARGGWAYVSDIRAQAELDSVLPPHSSWWGSLAAKLLERHGWRQDFAPRRNPTASRNGAREFYRYAPGGVA